MVVVEERELKMIGRKEEMGGREVGIKEGKKVGRKKKREGGK